MSAGYVRLPAAALPDLRWALAQGLHAIAEVRRVRGEFELYRRLDKSLPPDLVPVPGAADMDDAMRYAEALLWLECAQEIPDVP
ncbi:MAG: hypothetical protein QM581_06335 [Pseudomonas sp.]